MRGGTAKLRLWRGRAAEEEACSEAFLVEVAPNEDDFGDAGILSPRYLSAGEIKGIVDALECETQRLILDVDHSLHPKDVRPI